jgi:lipid-binding SYLF domain-containing protein
MCIRVRPDVAVVVLTLVAVGCSSSPDTPQTRQTLRSDAGAALDAMAANDAGLRDFIQRAHGYAVFPKVGKGAAVVGGARGRGVVYEQGRLIGYAELKQASIGAQAGAQTFSELIVFETPVALGKLKAGNFTLGAEASAAALKQGMAKEYRYQAGVAIFILPKSGVMAAAAVSGQKVTFKQASGDEGGTNGMQTPAASQPTTSPASPPIQQNQAR